jgi:hypothetical protein
MFSVANFSSWFSEDACGQSFTPNQAGPDGTGAPSTPTATIREICFGYRNYDESARSKTCYVYDQPLSDPSQIGQKENRVAVTNDYIDGSACGPGSYTRTFYFMGGILSITKCYYVYLQGPQPLRLNDGDYGGGSMIDYHCGLDSEVTTQFKITMEDNPDG